MEIVFEPHRNSKEHAWENYRGFHKLGTSWVVGQEYRQVEDSPNKHLMYNMEGEEF